ncbi:hypothetical protein ACC735_39710, partial [Rhizobium ruizarguesonis]
FSFVTAGFVKIPSPLPVESQTGRGFAVSSLMSEYADTESTLGAQANACGSTAPIAACHSGMATFAQAGVSNKN